MKYRYIDSWLQLTLRVISSTSYGCLAPFWDFDTHYISFFLCCHVLVSKKKITSLWSVLHDMFQYVIKGNSCMVLYLTGVFGCYNHCVLDPKVVYMTQQDCDDKEMMDCDHQIDCTLRHSFLLFLLTFDVQKKVYKILIFIKITLL